MGGYFGKRVVRAKVLAGQPAYVEVVDTDVTAYLNGLSQSSFLKVSDAKALWAVKVSTPAEEAKGTITIGGTAYGGTQLASYVVSSELYKRLKAHRFN